MKKPYKKIIVLFVFILIIGSSIFIANKINEKITDEKNGVGRIIDSYKGVNVYSNGDDYSKNHGKNYSKDGYYYGYKWQCVEFIKRFYYEAKSHKMPDIYGNAKDFFDESLESGQMNEKRGMLQYKNGEDEKPQPDDLIVFTDTTYGHVVIVTEVGENYIEVIQQNMGNYARSKFDLECRDGKYFVGGSRVPAGWLRVVDNNQ